MLCVMPWCGREQGRMIELLNWMRDLGGAKSHDVLLVAAKPLTEFDKADVMEAAKQVFNSMELITTYYEDPRPWPVNANLMFQRAARHVHEHRKVPWFLNEPDCIPLKPGWLDTLESTYKVCGKPFMGCIVTEPRHLTGNAIYPADFQNHSFNAMLTETVPWDVIDMEKILPKTHHTTLYQHAWNWNVPAQPAQQYNDVGTHFASIDDLSFLRPDAVIFHRNKDGSLIKQLRAVRFAAPPPPEERKHYPREKGSGERTHLLETGIFIRTYAGDAKWLPFCLQSIKKFASGFTRVKIVVPLNDVAIVKPIADQYGCEFEACEPDPCSGYIAQQITKLEADRFMHDRYILHMDADCLFNRPVTPSEFADGIRPVILYEPYENMNGSAARLWQKPTSLAVGYDVKHEFMRRHPFMYERVTYPRARKRIEEVTGKNWREYIVGLSDPNNKLTFSEFNFMGAFIWSRPDIKKRYSFARVGGHGVIVRPDTIRQFWSWGGITPEVRAEIEGILK